MIDQPNPRQAAEEASVDIDELEETDIYSSLTVIEKPSALTECQPYIAEIFDIVKAHYLSGVDSYTFDLRSIESTPLKRFTEPTEIAAFALRRIQLLHAICGPAPTTNKIVINQLNGAMQSLEQILPTMKHEAAQVRVLEGLEAFYAALEVVGSLAGPADPPVMLT